MKKKLVVPVVLSATRHNDHFNITGIRSIGKPVEVYEPNEPSSSSSSFGYTHIEDGAWNRVFARDKADLPN